MLYRANTARSGRIAYVPLAESVTGPAWGCSHLAVADSNSARAVATMRLSAGDQLPAVLRGR